MFDFNNIKLAKRLALGFGSLTLLACGIVGLALWGITTINKSMDEVLELGNRTRYTESIMTDIDNIRLSMWNIIALKDTVEKQKNHAEIEKLREDYKLKLNTLKAKATTETGRQLLDRLEQAITDTRSVNNRAIELAENGKEAEAIALFAKEGTEKNLKINEAMQELVAWREKRLTDTDAAAKAVVAKERWILYAAGLAILALSAFFSTLITRSISRPIASTVGLLEQISHGDLTQDVPAALRARKDEVGDLARAMQMTTESLSRLLREVSGGVQTLASSSTELSAVSSQTSAGVKAMAEKAATVAAAAEQSSANTVSVAAGMEQAATNLGSVAGATEEMSATVAEIAANSEKARAISEQASAQAQAINALMQQLGQAAREIGKVTETITDISSQTNLLALNATIEAARAGAAGKGFAVVANEIKELARQTAAATEDIKAKIGGVQHSAGSAITDIEQIAGVIREVGSIVASIAAAIEEQATVTKDVAGNIAQASAGVKEANGRVAQTAGVAKSIAQDIAAVNASVGEIREGGEQVRGSAAELSRLAEQLKIVVGKFKLTAAHDLAANDSTITHGEPLKWAA